MKFQIQSIKLNYKGKLVNGKRLVVISELPIGLTEAWNEVKKIRLLKFVAKPMMVFKPVNQQFPEMWNENMLVETKLLLYGFLPLGGIHTIKVVKIDAAKHVVRTNEFDRIAKIWNHKIELKGLTPQTVKYTDEIEIYAGMWTVLITYWAKLFYKHRHRRWMLVAERYA